MKFDQSQRLQLSKLIEMNNGHIRTPNNDVLKPQMFCDGQLFRDKFDHDDGYSTDSRSNTTASIYSPLSSSLSSLSTSEGSPHSGTRKLTVSGPQSFNQKVHQMQNMQSGPIPKGPNLVSKTALSKNGIMPVRKRGVKVEESENLFSLEDRLRALTTIDEEELGLAAANRSVKPDSETARITKNIKMKNISDQTRQNTKSVPNTNHMETRNNKIVIEAGNTDSSLNTKLIDSKVFLTAAAIDTFNPPHHLGAGRSETATGEFPTENTYYHPDSFKEISRKDWRDYTYSLAKESGVPAYNKINAALEGQYSHPDISSSFLQKHQKNADSEFYREQGENGLGIVKTDERGQFLRDHSFQENGLAPRVWTNGCYSEGDFKSGHSVFQTDVQSKDFTLVHNQSVQNDQYQKQQQQQQLNFTHQQKPHAEFVVTEQYVNNQLFNMNPDHSTKSSFANRVSYPSQSYPTFEHNHNVTLGESVTGFPEHPAMQRGNSFDQKHLGEYRRLNNVGLKRNSIDLGNISKMQKPKQIASDQYLLNRKHIFASSADIHKLFSGQARAPVSLQTSVASNDQAIDQCCAGGTQYSAIETAGVETSPTSQNPFHTTPKLQVIIPSDSTMERSSPDPFRDNHNIHIPPEAWVNVTSVQSSTPSETWVNLTSVPSSVPPEAWINVTSVPSCVPPEEEDSIYIHLQKQPFPLQPNLDRSTFQRSMFGSGEFSTDRAQVNCMSSGYSSESELQQIESNAEVIKKLLTMEGVEKITPYQVEQLKPSQMLLSRDSSIDTFKYEDMSENDSLYENQSMVTHKYDSMDHSSNRSNISPRSGFLQSTLSSDAYQTLPLYMTASEEQLQMPSSRNVSFTHTSINNSAIVTQNSNLSNTNNTQTYSVTSQNEVIRNNPLPFTDPALSLGIHHSRPSFSHGADNQDSNLAPHNMKNLAKITFYGRNSSLPTSQHNPYSQVISSCSCQDCHTSPAFYQFNEHEQSGNHAVNSHHNYPESNIYSDFTQLQSQEMVQTLSVPFETNTIETMQGNRLSTLV